MLIKSFIYFWLTLCVHSRLMFSTQGQYLSEYTPRITCILKETLGWILPWPVCACFQKQLFLRFMHFTQELKVTTTSASGELWTNYIFSFLETLRLKNHWKVVFTLKTMPAQTFNLTPVQYVLSTGALWTREECLSSFFFYQCCIIMSH